MDNPAHGIFRLAELDAREHVVQLLGDMADAAVSDADLLALEADLFTGETTAAVPVPNASVTRPALMSAITSWMSIRASSVS